MIAFIRHALFTSTRKAIIVHFDLTASKGPDCAYKMMALGSNEFGEYPVRVKLHLFHSKQ